MKEPVDVIEHPVLNSMHIDSIDTVDSLDSDSFMVCSLFLILYSIAHYEDMSTTLYAQHEDMLYTVDNTHPSTYSIREY